MSVDTVLPPRYFLGVALKQLREEAGLTQAELHRRSGVAQSSIALYETGARSPYYDTIAALATALGITASAIVSRAETIAAFHSA